MRIHPCVAITLALLLGTTEPGQAQQLRKETRDFAQLMPANSVVYVGINHPQIIKQCLGLLKESALNDYAGFRDDLRKRLKLDSGSEGILSLPWSTYWAALVTPELIDEIGRINGFAEVITGPEPGFVWVIDPGSSNLVRLVVRDILTLNSGMKSVRTVEGVRLYQSSERNEQRQTSPVLATTPGLIVVGSDADLVADVIRRDRGKQGKDTAPALTDLPEFQQFAEVRKHQQMFGYADLGKLDSLLQASATGVAALFDFKAVLGADCKELAVGCWLDNSGPHLDLVVKLGSKTPGPVVKFLSSRTVDPRVLHFALDDAFITMTAPFVGEPDDYNRLLAVLQKWAALVRPVNFKAVAHATPDGRRLVTSARDGLKLWDIETGQFLRTLLVTNPLLNLSLSADGQRIVTVERSTDKASREEFLAVTVRDAETGKPLHSGKMERTDRFAISADGKRIAYADDAGKLKVVDTADPGKVLLSLEPEPKSDDRISGICVSPDGKRIACSHQSGGIKIWTLEPKPTFQRIKAQGHSVVAMSFSPDGKHLAAGHAPEIDPLRMSGKTRFPGTIIKVFDAVKGDEVTACLIQGGMVTSMTYAPDGKRLLLNLLENIDTERLLRRLPQGMDIDPLTAPKEFGAEVAVKVWDLEKKKDMLTLRGESAITLAMTANGKRLIHANNFGQVKVRDVSNGKELLTLSDNPMTQLIRQVHAGLASPAGKELAASVHSATLVVAPSSSEGQQALVIVEMKDQATAKAFMDLLPFLLGNGQKVQTREIDKYTIHSLPMDSSVWEFSLDGVVRSWFCMCEQSWGRAGNIIVIGPSPKSVARSLSGGVARGGFAAQPDVARTLSGVKDANGLVVWSVHNLVKDWLHDEEVDLARTMKKFAGKGNPVVPNNDNGLVQHAPQQFKKISADLNRAMQDLSAGSLTATAKADRLTLSGSHPGLPTFLPHLIDAAVEWDLSRPRFEKPRFEKPDRNEGMPPKDFPGFPFPERDPGGDPPPATQEKRPRGGPAGPPMSPPERPKPREPDSYQRSFREAESAIASQPLITTLPGTREVEAASDRVRLHRLPAQDYDREIAQTCTRIEELKKASGEDKARQKEEIERLEAYLKSLQDNRQAATVRDNELKRLRARIDELE
jgi:WD40 repeat protein